MTVTETPRLLDPAAEVWALEYPGRLSESALAHLHRELQEALPDKRVVVVQDGARFRSLSSLDAAWQEAEAALPEGWRLTELCGSGAEWTAAAEPPGSAYRSGWSHGVPSTTWLGKGATGPTPAAALLALAAALRKPVTT